MNAAFAGDVRHPHRRGEQQILVLPAIRDHVSQASEREYPHRDAVHRLDPQGHREKGVQHASLGERRLVRDSALFLRRAFPCGNLRGYVVSPLHVDHGGFGGPADVAGRHQHGDELQGAEQIGSLLRRERRPAFGLRGHLQREHLRELVQERGLTEK